MKAWTDLENNPNITLNETSYSKYYINHGVKIEMFNDGRIEVKNTMTNSDHYENVPYEIFVLFETVGFDHGAFAMCSHIFKRRADKIMYNIDLAERDERYDAADRLRESYHKVINKHYDYEERISRLSPYL